jgi:hypothetical protein
MVFHQCYFQKYILDGIKDPPKRKQKLTCRCRQQVTTQHAQNLIDLGLAAWIVIKRIHTKAELPCYMCKGDASVKNCARCNDTRVIDVNYVRETYGDDIVATEIAQKTPRAATIERAHIERAYVLDMPEAKERIEDYGLSTLDARAFIGPNRVPMIGVEPPDDPKTGTGRRYDYGRGV